jgi:hypothetical protein
MFLYNKIFEITLLLNNLILLNVNYFSFLWKIYCTTSSHSYIHTPDTDGQKKMLFLYYLVG